MGPSIPELCAILFAMGTPAFLVFYFGKRWFQLKEKRIEVDAIAAAEKAAQYAVSNAKLEERVQVLEQIITDGGMQTAAQIEALREKPRIASGDKSQ